MEVGVGGEEKEEEEEEEEGGGEEPLRVGPQCLLWWYL